MNSRGVMSVLPNASYRGTTSLIKKEISLRTASLLTTLTLCVAWPVAGQLPQQRNQSQWVQAFLEKYHPAGYRLQLGSSGEGPVLGMTLEDANMLHASDSLQYARARDIALYILQTAQVDPPLVVVVVGWKSTGFVGAGIEKRFRFPVDSLRIVRDST